MHTTLTNNFHSTNFPIHPFPSSKQLWLRSVAEIIAFGCLEATAEVKNGMRSWFYSANDPTACWYTATLGEPGRMKLVWACSKKISKKIKVLHTSIQRRWVSDGKLYGCVPNMVWTLLVMLQQIQKSTQLKLHFKNWKFWSMCKNKSNNCWVITKPSHWQPWETFSWTH